MGEKALVEGEPAVICTGLERVEEASCPLEPAARHGRGAAKVELVGRKPGRHAGCRRRIAPLPIQAVCLPAGGEDHLGVVEPPGRPAQALVALRCLLAGEGLLEGVSRVSPATFAQGRPAVRRVPARGFVRRHAIPFWTSVGRIAACRGRG